MSVIMPAHNAMPYLHKGLSSVTRQTIGVRNLELIAIDDGSTDGSGDALDAFAAQHPGLVQVHHQEASGTPSAPRNRGIDLARGEYVFFLDADDYLADRGLERMVAMAEAHDSDVVLGKVVGHGGRGAPRSMFHHDQPRADLYTSRVYWTLGPWKLFRRSLLEDHHVRFPLDRRTGEDQVFTFLAYYHARNISVVAGHDCYHIVQRDDGGNLTSGGMKPPAHAEFNRQTTLELMTDLVGTTVPAGPGRDHLMKRHWEVEGANELARLLRMRTPEEQQRHFEKLRDLLERWYTPGTAATLHPDLRLAYHLILTAGLDDVLEARRRKDDMDLTGAAGRLWAALPGRGPDALAKGDTTTGPWVEVTDGVPVMQWLDEAAARGTRLHLRGTGRLDGVPSDRLTLHLELAHTGTGETHRVPAPHEDGKFTAEFDLCDAVGPLDDADGVWEVRLNVAVGGYETTVPYGVRLGGPMRRYRRLRVHLMPRWRGRFGRVRAELGFGPDGALQLRCGDRAVPVLRGIARRLRATGESPHHV
ncbi:glycosyltransferase family 2 protein [Glycomyces niveus]|uniref:Glycosyltransferase family 2 protein n=1 Tax=Glycomyces niveus TaxID=2820287 RepID=A0ABS3U578_9ACTN|nr:glycosyltransferase family 2 protein [Glycomyces sp. NEAU-S30]MBO3733939.1 glycosyltransferase family 2 protein [Glycomyces sp. NEAU-S30]